MTLMQNAITAAPLLSVQGLTKRYGPRIGCADVGFDLYPGEVLGIVGESGSGKSTLLSLLCGRCPPDRGSVQYRDGAGDWLDLYAASEAERRTLLRTEWGFVEQNPRDGLRMGVSAGANIGERLMALGERRYGSLRQTAESWLSNATALRELGYSTQQQLDLVETLNNALVISAAKGQRAASVMDAWSKAMALGKLSGGNELGQWHRCGSTRIDRSTLPARVAVMNAPAARMLDIYCAPRSAARRSSAEKEAVWPSKLNGSWMTHIWPASAPNGANCHLWRWTPNS